MPLTLGQLKYRRSNIFPLFQGPRDCGDQVTTTTESNTGCCQVVTIASSGDTVDYQWNRLGVFSFQYSSPDGRPVYYMSKHDQWLYYVDWLGVWYVNDTPLENMGGIINWSDAFCPEDIQEPWSFYRWEVRVQTKDLNICAQLDFNWNYLIHLYRHVVHLTISI